MPVPGSEAYAGGSASRRVLDAVACALPPDMARRVRIVPCDRDENGAFVRCAGLERACAALVADWLEAGSCQALLIVGLLPMPAGLDETASERASAALLPWPGVAYLRYGFSRENLVKAADAAIRGAKEPLPRGLLPTLGDVRRRTSEVRHWLENRLRNADGARNALEAELLGAAILHESHLEPVAAISTAHRNMMERLWALEGLAARMAPRAGGLSAVRRAMDEFELCWRDLEESRTAVRSARRGERRECLDDMLKRHLAVRETVSAAIAAIDNLDGELCAGREA